ncbi:hypothetical protein FQZ97_915680 [compost metagenome]
MKVAQQVAALAHVAALEGGLFLFEVLAQALQGGLVHRAGLADQAHLDHAARLEGFARFVVRGLHHVPAAARTHGDDAACGQPHKRLAHQGTAAVEQDGQVLFTQARTRREPLREDGFDDALGNDCGIHHAALYANSVPCHTRLVCKICAPVLCERPVRWCDMHQQCVRGGAVVVPRPGAVAPCSVRGHQRAQVFLVALEHVDGVGTLRRAGAVVQGGELLAAFTHQTLTVGVKTGHGRAHHAVVPGAQGHHGGGVGRR